MFSWFRKNAPQPDPAFAAALDRWKQAHLPHQRIEALTALAAFPEAREELERTLKSLASPLEQAAAARLLGRRKEAASAPLLARVVSYDFWRASEGARAGGGFGLPADPNQARRQMNAVRLACVNALAEIGGPDAKAALERAAKDPDPDVAAAASSALA